MLGNKIYTLRKAKGLTQEQLANLVGVSNKAVSKWETDEANPDIGLMPKIAKALDVTIGELFGEALEEEIPEGKRARILGFDGEKTDTPDRYEFVSDKKAKSGKPYLHIHYGKKWDTFNAKARGVIAIGNNAKGIISIGFISSGIVSIGLLSLGLLTIGLLSLGLLSLGIFTVGAAAIGSVSIGVLAIGAVAVGVLAIGSLSVGVWSIGALSVGYWAYAGEYGRAIGRNIGRWWRGV